MDDPYAVLGVSREVSQEEIRKAYRALALRWHPDKHPADQRAHAEERFKRVAAAFKAIGTPEDRRQYHENNNASGAARSGGARLDPADLFHAFFRAAAHGGDAGDFQYQASGRHLRHTVELSLEEAVGGCERTLHVPCQSVNSSTGRLTQQVDAITVRVPAGMRSGVFMAVRTSDSSGVALRLQLRFRLRFPHDVFERVHGSDCDLQVRVTVSLYEALAGFSASVPVIQDDGRAAVETVASCVRRPGECVAVLPHRGLPHHNLHREGKDHRPVGTWRGDLRVIADVQFPPPRQWSTSELKVLHRVLSGVDDDDSGGGGGGGGGGGDGGGSGHRLRHRGGGGGIDDGIDGGVGGAEHSHGDIVGGRSGDGDNDDGNDQEASCHAKGNGDGTNRTKTSFQPQSWGSWLWSMLKPNSRL